MPSSVGPWPGMSRTLDRLPHGSGVQRNRRVGERDVKVAADLLVASPRIRGDQP